MFDPITLDQLRAFLTVVEEGSFSAAARKLQRVQSAISTAMANLETQLGVTLWDRTTKIATLTDQGQAVLSATRRILMEVDALRRLTAGMVTGVEAAVFLCVDALFPLGVLVELCAEFAREFPSVDLRVDTLLMSNVSALVLDGTASIGVVSPLGLAPGLERKVIAPIRMIPVVGPQHPLAAHKGPVSTHGLADAIQIVLSERNGAGVADQAVLSPRTWRVADLHTKHAMVRAGLGWGNLPEHLVREDLDHGKLVAIRPAVWGEDEHTLYLWAIYRSYRMFGPAHRWLLEAIERHCTEEASPARAPAAAPRKSRRKT